MPGLASVAEVKQDIETEQQEKAVRILASVQLACLITCTLIEDCLDYPNMLVIISVPLLEYLKN